MNEGTTFFKHFLVMTSKSQENSGVQSWPFQPLFNITFSLLFVNLAVKWLKSEIKSDPKVAKKCYLEPLLLEILVKGDKK